MTYKPGDFFIGVIDFFGILVPGAVFLFLHAHLLRTPLGWENGWNPTAIGMWVAFFVGAYVVGHVFLGIGVPLNKLYDWWRPESNDHYYDEIKDSIQLPTGIDKNRTDVFYRAFSTVCLSDAAAFTEIERQMAEYKLFRSLVLVFALDVVAARLFYEPHWSRYALSGLLCVVSVARFLFLIGWAQRLTFEYYYLITKPSAEDEPKNTE